jgi:hypothetical protein
MMKVKLIACGGLLAVFAVLSTSCGGFTQGVQDGMSLQFIGKMYQKYCDDKKKAPSGPDDLASIAVSKEEKDAVQSIKDNKVTVIWNVYLNDASAFPDGKSNTVIGYGNTVFSGARMVLMADGQVPGIPEDDFKKKTQAKPGTGSPTKDKK